MQHRDWIQIIAAILTLVVYYFVNERTLRREIHETETRLGTKLDGVREKLDGLRDQMHQLDTRVAVLEDRGRPESPAHAPPSPLKLRRR